jgi:CheY-like chemotaxis protein
MTLSFSVIASNTMLKMRSELIRYQTLVRDASSWVSLDPNQVSANDIGLPASAMDNLAKINARHQNPFNPQPSFRLEDEPRVEANQPEGILAPVQHKQNRIPSEAREDDFGTLQIDDCSCMCNRILIVDDNEYNIFTLQKKLTKRGYVVYTAENGLNALEKLHSVLASAAKCQKAACRGVATIFMDVDMPVMNGIECTLRLTEQMVRGDISFIPIIGCSAFDQPQDRLEGFEAGMSDYLGKPVLDVNLDEALTRVRKFKPGAGQLKQHTSLLRPESAINMKT